MFKLIIPFIFSVTLAFSQPSNVLFIGNSYTHMNDLYKIYENLSVSKAKPVKADTLAVSGSTLMQHTQRANTYKKIKSRNWDYVFIQGFSRELSYDSIRIEKETIPYAKQLIDSIKTYNPCASIYYYMTWGYANGFRDSIQGDDYFAMQERIYRGYLQLSRATGGFPIAPVGLVWQEIRRRYPEVSLYTSDDAHPTPYGSYVAACTFFTSIYKETPLNGTAPKKIEPIYALNIQQTAADFVLKNYSHFRLDTIQKTSSHKPKVDFSIKEEWLSITLENKSTPGLLYYWDFGDGKTSTKPNPKYYYAKDGKYTVTLSVQSGCNWYKSKKVIKVSKNKKDAKSKVVKKAPKKKKK